MQHIDLNLLPVLHALLEEEHVTRAAQRLHLSVPGTSRALERCRQTFGDPLLVRRGRTVVMTPRARELQPVVASLMAQLDVLFAAPAPFDPTSLRRTFVIRANEAVVGALAPALAAATGAAPEVEVRFESEAADDIEALRDGRVDLAVGSYGDLTGDLRAAPLATETLVGVLRAGHPLAGRTMTVGRLAALDHVVVSRRGHRRGPLDDRLAERGHRRRVVAVVPSFAAALAVVATTDATCLAPRRLATSLGAGLATYRSPVTLPSVEVAVLWHQRDDVDPGHAWFRERIQSAVPRS